MPEAKRMTTEEIQQALAQFCGTESYHRLTILARWLLATDGVKFIADEAGADGAYWLIDAIASYQHQFAKDPSLKYFQVWTLKVDLANKTAVLVCERDTDDIVVTQAFEYTDFNLAEIRLYVEGEIGKQMVIMLPSER